MQRFFGIFVVLLTVAAGISDVRGCPEVACPEGCEREPGTPQHRCPWCVCHPVAARKTLEKFEQRHCPKELVEFVMTRSEHLKDHVFKLSDAVRQQKVVLKNFGKLHGPQSLVTGRKQCATPLCDRNCTLVTGDHGCPACECPPTHCPRQKCPPGCHRETDVPHDRCPECVCEAEAHTLKQLECPTPMCDRNCTLVTGDHGCPDCECPPAHCPRKKCPSGCHRETGPLENRCPECVCEAEAHTLKQLVCPTPMCARNCTLVTGDHGCPDCECPPTHCPRKKCPSGCHRETGPLENRCPECVCESEALTVAPSLECATPICAPNCSLVTGDHGCPACECPPTHCPRKKCPPNCHREQEVVGNRCPECICEGDAGAQVIPTELHGKKKRDSDKSSEESSEESTETTQRRQKRDKPRKREDDSSEESSEESSEDNRIQRTRSRESSEETHARPSRPLRAKRDHPLGGYGKKHSPSGHHQLGHIQCTPPVCEEYCTTKPGRHGCLVCDCPDVCPDIVCGDGCHPEYTEHRKCERCVCNPLSERQSMADVFYSHCGEGRLRTLLIEFVNLKKTLEILERQLKEHDEELTKIEQVHGVSEPLGPEHGHGLAALHHRGHHGDHHGKHHHHGHHHGGH